MAEFSKGEEEGNCPCDLQKEMPDPTLLQLPEWYNFYCYKDCTKKERTKKRPSLCIPITDWDEQERTIIQFLSREAYDTPLTWCCLGLWGPCIQGFYKLSRNATRARIKLPAQGPKEIPGLVQMRDVIPQLFRMYAGIQPSPKYFCSSHT